MLYTNKKTCDVNLIYSMLDEKISVKRSIGGSTSQLEYWKEVILHIQLGLTILKLIKNEIEEPYNMVRRVYESIEIQWERDLVSMKL